MLKNISISFLLFSLLLSTTTCAQVTVPLDRPAIGNEAFDLRLQELLSFTVPLVGVEQLAAADANDYLILDAREFKEYKISHIPGAQHFGYKKPDWKSLENISLDQPIVLYCSVGYRSEKMGEEFRKKGYTQVFNLYGSVFEWANSGKPLESGDGSQTNQVHTYNKKWSQWVEDKNALEKVW